MKLCLILLFGGLLHAQDFSFAIIPDPHPANTLYHASVYSVFDTQMAWIASNVNTGSWNIKGVFSTGDYGTPNLANSSILPRVWQGPGSVGSGDWSLVDATGVPWLTAPGNHDYDTDTPPPANRKSDLFNTLAYSHISGKSWYGNWWNTADNTTSTKSTQWIAFTVGTLRFMVMSLELFPRNTDTADLLTWAGNEITTYVAAHPHTQVLLLTHGYMKADGSLLAKTDVVGANQYFSGSPQPATSGAQLLAWAQTLPNVRAIFNGHYIFDDGVSYYSQHAHRVDTGLGGGPLYGFFTNYQILSVNPGGTEASQSILLVKFKPSSSTIELTNFNTSTQTADTTTSFSTFGGSATVGTYSLAYPMAGDGLPSSTVTGTLSGAVTIR